jgi:2-keto-4-pentenoate hydratase/2-oxohepta-3-ene-1,7-dioic acid hydratase in catechol pathway
MRIGRVLFGGREVPVSILADGSMRTLDGADVPAEDAVLLPPVSPSKIVCVGRNYVEHAKELGNPMPERPLLFLKAPSSILAPGGRILLPEDSAQVEYEGEIALVVGRTCHRLPDGEDPLASLRGVTPLNDVTARDLQRLDVQFTRAKSFDTFCPFGPWIETEPEWDRLAVATELNGRRVQEGRAADMAFSIAALVRYISRAMTLNPGDLIATGTPAGVGRLAPGDRVAVEVAGIRLENWVAGWPGS